MFSGIVEALGLIEKITAEKSNIHFAIAAPFVQELKVDQSIAHNGVCLTVVEVLKASYTVTAIEETLNKTNLKDLKVGDGVNLERCISMNTRIDGHFVQGHVDQTAVCTSVKDMNGSKLFTFNYGKANRDLIVEKGSVCVNGVSLTVVAPKEDTFSVAIIPYTFENTTFKNIKPGDAVNIEFDILGKYAVNYLRNKEIK